MGLVRPPSRATLRKYGLTYSTWDKIWNAQGQKCGLCGGQHNKWFVEHEHTKQYSKMPSEIRSMYVRGIVGFVCNKFLIGKHTLTTARLVVKYLESYEARR